MLYCFHLSILDFIYLTFILKFLLKLVFKFFLIYNLNKKELKRKFSFYDR